MLVLKLTLTDPDDGTVALALTIPSIAPQKVIDPGYNTPTIAGVARFLKQVADGD